MIDVPIVMIVMFLKAPKTILHASASKEKLNSAEKYSDIPTKLSEPPITDIIWKQLTISF